MSFIHLRLWYRHTARQSAGSSHKHGAEDFLEILIEHLFSIGSRVVREDLVKNRRGDERRERGKLDAVLFLVRQASVPELENKLEYVANQLTILTQTLTNIDSVPINIRITIGFVKKSLTQEPTQQTIKY